MKIKINGFRRIKSIELTTKKITLIAAKNENGKTSFLQGIAAAFGILPPIVEMAKKYIKDIIHTGQPVASSQVETDSGFCGIKYKFNGNEPDFDLLSEGEIPLMSTYASGIKTIFDEKNMTEAISKIISAYPTKEMLSNELNRPDLVEKLWETISVSGWDAAHESARKKGTILKSKWQDVTGKPYGKRIASSWVPSEWDFDLTTETIESLEKKLKEESDNLKAAEAMEVVETIDQNRIDEAKKQLIELNKSLEKIQSEIELQKISYRTTKEEIAKMTDLSEIIIQPCPNCNINLSVVNGKILESDKLEKMDDNKDPELMKDTLKKIEKKGIKLESDLIDIQSSIKSCNKTIETGIVTKTDTDKTTDKTVEECTALRDKAQSRLTAFKNKHEAEKIANDVELNQSIVGILSPKGLRQAVLNEKLTDFNVKLDNISKVTKWEQVRLNSDMTVTWKGWLYPYFISNSAKWKVRLCLQIVIALFNKDELVLIDDAEILDSEHKNSLFKLLTQMPFESIVAMTLPNKEVMPNLEKLNGVSYWIEDGRVC